MSVDDRPASQIEAQITALTERWYALIAHEHHKDRDCHWHVRQTWSYGDQPRWAVEHYGYIVGERGRDGFKSHIEALRWLESLISELIDREQRNQNANHAGGV